LPHDRRTRLAIKFELVTKLRGGEFLPLRKDDVFHLGGDDPYVFIPLERVKNRKHDLLQPLSSLAVASLRHRNAVADASTSRWAIRRPGRPCVIERTRALPASAPCLAWRFTPHDLRRTASTVARTIGVPLSKVSMCLDHAVRREDGFSIPSVTRRHYVHAHQQELAEKREVLEKLADEVRRIVGEQPELAMAA
jgi:integrase